jgi:hypothetical protein
MRDHQSFTTGITDAIEGNIDQEGANPTAFQVGVDREAALQRLRLPLKQFQYALEWEFNNRVELIKQVYSDFQVEQIEDPEDIMAYLKEVDADRKFYFIENEGEAGKEKFFAKRYRQVKMSLEQDEKGNFVPSDQDKFFHIKPEDLIFEGGVTVRVGSLLVQSTELERADVLQMSNVIVPLILGQGPQAPGDPNVVGKPVKQLLQAFDYDPKKWLPDSWLKVLYNDGTELPTPAAQPTISPIQPGTPPGTPAAPASTPLQTVAPQRQLARPNLSARFGAAFNAFRQPAPPVR